MRILIATAAIALSLTHAYAQQPKAATPAKPAALVKAPKVEPGFVIKPSKLAVKATVDAIAKAAEEKGAKVIARVDHAAGAKAVGVDMKASEVLIFGNPKIGTPLMQINPRAGLDLPLKVLAYEDAAGKTWVVYAAPRTLGQRYGLKSKTETEALKTAAGAIDGIMAASGIAP
jgi:uncharacterized protein (DUF302 family)